MCFLFVFHFYIIVGCQIKYQTASRQFQAKYEQEFEAFRQMILSTEPPFEMEQDYFDWEAAVTGASDMKKEIKRLENLTFQS